jgi:hypothetical protein
MRVWVAKVDQQAIPEILGNMAIKALDHLSTSRLIRPDHLPQVFQVEVAGQRCRIDQIAEHDGELTAFGL